MKTNELSPIPFILSVVGAAGKKAGRFIHTFLSTNL